MPFYAHGGLDAWIHNQRPTDVSVPQHRRSTATDARIAVAVPHGVCFDDTAEQVWFSADLTRVNENLKNGATHQPVFHVNSQILGLDDADAGRGRAAIELVPGRFFMRLNDWLAP